MSPGAVGSNGSIIHSFWRPARSQSRKPPIAPKSPMPKSVRERSEKRGSRTPEIRPVFTMGSTLQHIAPPSDKLPRRFYDRPALPVARDLLGKILVTAAPAPGAPPASWRWRRTSVSTTWPATPRRAAPPRTEVLFGPPGRAYVYLIYGMHHCFNVVTSREGRAAAVLIRGVEPIEGLPPEARTDGPGRLCRRAGHHAPAQPV